MSKRGTLRNGKSKGSSPVGSFARLWRHVVNSARWRALSPPAAKMFCIALVGHNGRNNGQIRLGVREAAELAGLSKTAATRALAELVQAGFLAVETRGAFTTKRQAALYRVTCEPTLTTTSGR